MLKSIFIGKIKKEFCVFFSSSMPDFKKIVANEIHNEVYREFLGGSLLYSWDYSDDLHFFILITFTELKHGEKFFIEGAWSKSEQFPFMRSPMFPIAVPKSDIEQDIPVDGQMRFRIGCLWQPYQNYCWDYSWEKQKIIPEDKEMSEDDIQAVIEPLIKDSTEKITKYLVPYYYGVIREYQKGNLWKKYSAVNIEKKRKDSIIKRHGGLIDQECSWAGCNQKRVKGSVMCVDHLYENIFRSS